MAEYLTNTTDLTKVASAIREKGGTSDQLIYPDGFVTAIGNIQTSVTQQRVVNLSMASGNQVITPDDGYTLSKVTVTKPDTLIPDNIKKDVNIGGVVGTMSGGGSIQWYAPID